MKHFPVSFACNGTYALFLDALGFDGAKVVCLEECKPADIFALAQLFYRQVSCLACALLLIRAWIMESCVF
jgi:hypothetical protein